MPTQENFTRKCIIMTEEAEIQQLYQETVDKILKIPMPDPASYIQGFMILSTLNKVLGMKNLRAEVQINITETKGVNSYD